MTLKVAFVIFFYWSPAEYQPIYELIYVLKKKENSNNDNE